MGTAFHAIEPEHYEFVVFVSCVEILQSIFMQELVMSSRLLELGPSRLIELGWFNFLLAVTPPHHPKTK